MEKFAQDIILKPVVTEESMMGTAMKKYTFIVAKDANKVEIAKAVEKLFGRFEGYKPSRKKAVVTLTEDSKTIEFFDGMF